MINFGNNLHPDLKIKNNVHKYLLRKYLITSSEFATSKKLL